MIRVSCPHCAKILQIQDRFAGKQGKCPGCSQLFTIPAATPGHGPEETRVGAPDIPAPPPQQQQPAAPRPAGPSQTRSTRSRRSRLAAAAASTPGDVPEGGGKMPVTAILSLLFAVFSCGLLGIPAVICGHLALGKIKRTRGRGKPLAIIGLILGYLSIVGLIVFLIAAIPLLAKAKDLGRQVMCMTQLRQLGLALDAYPDAHGDGTDYPATLGELYGSKGINSADAFVCPADDGPMDLPGTTIKTSYKYFGETHRFKITRDAPSDLMVVWDRKAFHPEGRTALFLDGSVKVLSENAFRTQLNEQIEEINRRRAAAKKKADAAKEAPD